MGPILLFVVVLVMLVGGFGGGLGYSGYSRGGYGRGGYYAGGYARWHPRPAGNAHRRVFALLRGEIPAGMNVCHTCDNPPCVNPAHLWLGTDADNMRDRDRKGRTGWALGSTNGQAKLTEEAIEVIRSLHRQGLSQQKIADRFGVVQTTISRVLLGQRWTHVRCAA